MFRQTYQSGLLSILSSQGSKPLQTWHCQVTNGYIKRITDNDTKSLAIEMISNNVSATFITCPPCSHDSLGIKMTHLNMYIKNLRRYFVMEIEILDSEHMHRRFKISTFAAKTKIGPFGTHSPLNWTEGWNRLSLNLQSFTRTVYGTDYIECRRITIHANCRIRRVFFADREYKEDELPTEYQLRCRLEQIKRQPSKKIQTTVSNKKANPSSMVMSQMPSRTVEKQANLDRHIPTPQGSLISDVGPAELLREQSKDGLVATVIGEMNNFNVEEVPAEVRNLNEDENHSNNAYRPNFFNFFRH